jgi:hypothetical protein
MAGVSNIYRVIIIILLVYIIWVDHTYVQVGWCESEIDVLRNTVAEIHTILKQ